MNASSRERCIARARERLATLPFWGQVVVGAAAGALLLPWLVRFYNWYWDAVLGRPGALLESVLPAVR